MKLSINTDCYNEKRYGRPYIARLSNTDGKVIDWGTYLGGHGEEGMLEIEATPGDVIMWGQKDFRGNKGFPNYGVLDTDGQLITYSKANAIKRSREFASDAISA